MEIEHRFIVSEKASPHIYWLVGFADRPNKTKFNCIWSSGTVIGKVYRGLDGVARHLDVDVVYDMEDENDRRLIESLMNL